MKSEDYGEYSVDDEDQLQPSDTLDDRGVDDALDEGYVARDGWSPGQGYGNTADEESRGESLEQRISQEEPDFDYEHDSWSEDDDSDNEAGSERSGRLASPAEADSGDDDDPTSDVYADDVGIDGSAATAEEAAMHVIDERE